MPRRTSRRPLLPCPSLGNRLQPPPQPRCSRLLPPPRCPPRPRAPQCWPLCPLCLPPPTCRRPSPARLLRSRRRACCRPADRRCPPPLPTAPAPSQARSAARLSAESCRPSRLCPPLPSLRPPPPRPLHPLPRRPCPSSRSSGRLQPPARRRQWQPAARPPPRLPLPSLPVSGHVPGHRVALVLADRLVCQPASLRPAAAVPRADGAGQWRRPAAGIHAALSLLHQPPVTVQLLPCTAATRLRPRLASRRPARTRLGQLRPAAAFLLLPSSSSSLLALSSSTSTAASLPPPPRLRPHCILRCVRLVAVAVVGRVRARPGHAGQPVPHGHVS